MSTQSTNEKFFCEIHGWNSPDKKCPLCPTMSTIPKEIQKQIFDASNEYPKSKNYGYVEIGWVEIRDLEKAAFESGGQYGYQLATDGREELKELLFALEDYFDDRADVQDADTEDYIPRPNTEMSFLVKVREAIKIIT